MRVSDIIFCCSFLEIEVIKVQEDTTATEDSLTDVTIENVLTDNLYNDLGFIVNNKLDRKSVV